MKPRPEDFAVRYYWYEGTVPPPDHYEFTIRVGYGPRDGIDFTPDYPGPETPMWTEPFSVSEDDLDRLYVLMARKGAFAPDWARDEDRGADDEPVGGSQEWLHCIAWGKAFRVPHATLDPQAAREILDAVRALAPKAIWTKLMAQQEGYARSYREQQQG